MIDIISKYEYKIPYKFTRLDNIDEIQAKLVIIDEDFLDFEKLKIKVKENRKMHVIVISNDNVYSAQKFQLMLENSVDHLIDNDKFEMHLYPLLKMLEKKYRTIDRIKVDKNLKQLIIGDDMITLTKREAQIYDYLLENRGKLCLRKNILTEVLGYHTEADTRIVDVYIKHLRSKITEYEQEIKTERGKGYILL